MVSCHFILKLQLEENFFRIQPDFLKRLSDFTVERQVGLQEQLLFYNIPLRSNGCLFRCIALRIITAHNFTGNKRSH